MGLRELLPPPTKDQEKFLQAKREQDAKDEHARREGVVSRIGQLTLSTLESQEIERGAIDPNRGAPATEHGLAVLPPVEEVPTPETSQEQR